MSALPTEVTNPFLTYNFLIKWDGKAVAAVTTVSGLTRRTAVVSFHAGGQPQARSRSPDRRTMSRFACSAGSRPTPRSRSGRT